mmetsp:Transcript_19582/g.45957  ORF Transcript_19582/g.45957 Transcript_19582/m.45957 type:complete len:112 (-) Transcript_19582:865-1200(-)
MRLGHEEGSRGYHGQLGEHIPHRGNLTKHGPPRCSAMAEVSDKQGEILRLIEHREEDQDGPKLGGIFESEARGSNVVQKYEEASCQDMMRDDLRADTNPVEQLYDVQKDLR